MTSTLLIFSWAACAGAVAALGLAVYNRLGWPRVDAPPSGHAEVVSALIPARNEERLLPATLNDLLAQPGLLREVLVYDDHSTDRTAEVIRAAAARSPRVRRVEPDPLPEGWCGKPFACARLAAAARGEWLLFVDADTRLEAGAVARIVAEAERREVTFLSCWPGLRMVGWAEQVFLPMLNFVVFTLFPAPVSLRRHLPSLGLAHGACILARRADYVAVGGHERVRDQMFEDTALARVWRASGRRGLCLDGQDLVWNRMYDSFGALWSGFSRTIYTAFRHEANFWLFLGFHGLCFLFPFLAAPAAAARGLWIYPLWAAMAAGWLARWVHARHFRQPRWSALLLPVAEAGLLALALTSWFQCRTGRGIAWKGRRYRRGGTPA